MNGVMRVLRSSRTTIALLLVMSIWAGILSTFASGTGGPWRAAGAAPGLLLAANIIACTWSRLKGRPLSRIRHSCDLALHLALVIILGGMLLKSVTAVTTVSYLFSGEPIDSLDDSVGRRVPLGFGLVLRGYVESYYPARLQARVERAGDSTRFEELVLVEGRTATTRGGVQLGIRIDGERMVLIANGHLHELTRDTVVEADGWRVLPLADRRDVKKVVAEVDVLEKGGAVRQGRIGMNERFVHRGTRLTLTGWGVDERGIEYVSIQAVKEPFELFFWLGAILFSVASPLLLLAKAKSILPR